MTDKQKQELLKGLIAAAILPMEIEDELMDFISAKSPKRSIQTDFGRGAECMRQAAIGKILELEEGCLGIQKAAFIVVRNAIEYLEVPA